MNRSDLFDALAEHHPQLTADDAEAAVKTILDAMTQALARGQRIELRGFGSFAVVARDARLARNPRTGETVAVPPRRTLHFKPGKALREAVDAAAHPGTPR
ncbi:MAG: integration host factor subunit beta [Tepidimonas ignava]|uniref:Integration host factor subunit beta n=1 Tax=Tepidimonas ignava TaxID=114249 RepID=A0A4R3LAV5_9BURK|nr:integration host factor subunit beta [Tepidimonas ignava]MCX7814948.1 integration host factor subunit beta [Tepidimonas ignava]TCS95414.1 integration host factor subunit beta [Tepidimonas ignava]TSE20027.1 Integration host factor subunit beta [Tepidimonas ignava]